MSGIFCTEKNTQAEISIASLRYADAKAYLEIVFMGEE